MSAMLMRLLIMRGAGFFEGMGYEHAKGQRGRTHSKYDIKRKHDQCPP